MSMSFSIGNGLGLSDTDGLMEFHPIASIFPLIRDDELQELADDIREHGLKEPIWTYEEKILDGRNRSAACVIAGVEPRYREFRGTAEEAFRHVWSLNFHRRHMTQSQKGACAADAVGVIQDCISRAKERQGKRTDLVETFPQSDGKKSRDEVGEMFGVSGRYVDDAISVKRENPELHEKVKSGEMTLPQAKREIKEKNREKRRGKNRRKVSTAKDKIPKDTRFATITIDPPWDWDDEGDKDQLGRARPDYASMPIEQISELPVGNLADEDCHLYLWITNRSLPKGFALIEKWGFRYITCLTWCKPSFGMGNYFRGSTEQILFAVKGSQSLKRKDAGTWFEWQRGDGGHSSKPLEFYGLVESCSPGPFLEMFSRCERKDWFAWGESS